MSNIFELYVPKCSNKEPHMFHHIKTVIEERCSGKPYCGQWAHAPHSFEHEVEEFCNGMCECSSRDHGPGRHK